MRARRPGAGCPGAAADPGRRDGGRRRRARADAPVLAVARLATTDRLYVRGADLAIVNSGACSLLAQAERLECLGKLSGDVASPPRPAVSPSSD